MFYYNKMSDTEKLVSESVDEAPEEPVSESVDEAPEEPVVSESVDEAPEEPAEVPAHQDEDRVGDRQQRSKGNSRVARSRKEVEAFGNGLLLPTRPGEERRGGDEESERDRADRRHRDKAFVLASDGEALPDD